MRRHATPAILGALGAAAGLAGCLMGPNYSRPAVNAPAVYRNAPPAPVAGPDFATQQWFAIFQDPTLQQLLRTAITQNYNVRIAATRILQAEQQVGITRAEEFPLVDANASATSMGNPKVASVFPAYQENYGALNLSVLWNLDFWGRYRRATEAARDQLLASQWGQKEVVSSVVAQVAEAYFQLRQIDDALAIAQRTLSARQDSLRLTQTLEAHGSSSQLDVAQAQELVAEAAAAVPDYERQQSQQEDLISTLIGANPEDIPRGLPLDQQPNPPAVPAGLPSALLQRRPDILEAEATLMAANANVGVARAEMFPSVTLTADGGLESYALNRLFTGAAKQWDINPQLSQPVFAAGSLHAELRLTQAEKQQMLLTYLQAIQQAFQQVSDALVAVQKDHLYRQQLQVETQAASQADTLSTQLYQNGGASYLQVLTADTNYFAAQLSLSQAELNERLALVELYNALGGGWQ